MPPPDFEGKKMRFSIQSHLLASLRASRGVAESWNDPRLEVLPTAEESELVKMELLALCAIIIPHLNPNMTSEGVTSIVRDAMSSPKNLAFIRGDTDFIDLVLSSFVRADQLVGAVAPGLVLEVSRHDEFLRQFAALLPFQVQELIDSLSPGLISTALDYAVARIRYCNGRSDLPRVAERILYSIYKHYRALSSTAGHVHGLAIDHKPRLSKTWGEEVAVHERTLQRRSEDCRKAAEESSLLSPCLVDDND